MTLRLQLVNLAWDGVANSTGYDILLDGSILANTGARARTTKILIPEGAEHVVSVRAKPSGLEQKARFEWAKVTDAPPPPSPSGGLSNPYFDFDFSKIANPPWTSMQWDGGPGADDPGSTGVQVTPDGHSIATVTVPDGVGRALRFEIRDSDGAWPLGSDGKRSQVRSSAAITWNGSPMTVGAQRWFFYELYLPNNNPVGEYFDWGRTNWNTWIGLHPDTGNTSGNDWGCFDMGTDGPYTHPFYMTWKLAGGGGINPTDTLIYPRLFQLTNADGSRYAPNYNRRIQLLLGVQFSPLHSGGWMEAWVDGINVVPRFSHATMWTGDTQTYFKIGPYKSSSSTSLFPTNGKTLMYVTKIQFGTTQ